MGVAPERRRAADTTAADASALLADASRRPAERITLAAIRLDESLTGAERWTEQDLAGLTGLSRHQVRQAVARLRADGTLLRVWSPATVARPAPAYTWADR